MDSLLPFLQGFFLPYNMSVYPGARRGRDDSHESPPAQIRTSASTHTALLKDEWRENNATTVFSTHTVQALGHA